MLLQHAVLIVSEIYVDTGCYEHRLHYVQRNSDLNGRCTTSDGPGKLTVSGGIVKVSVKGVGGLVD